MRFQNLVLAAALFALAAADRVRADDVYYVGNTNGSSYSFGTVNSAGQTTVLGKGLTFGGAGAEQLMFAPNGTLYGFDVAYGGGSGAWGSINTATGAFTQIGDLNTYFPYYGGDHNANYGFSLAFGPSGNLYVSGSDVNNNFVYGTLSLTSGAFTEIAASPVGFAGSLANTVPEPSTFVLLGAGAFALFGYRSWRRRWRQ